MASAASSINITPARPPRPSGTLPTNGNLIARIPNPAAIFTPSSVDFGGYAQQQLGDLGTGTDGFDALFNSVASIIDGDTADLGNYDSLLSAMAFTPGDFASTYLAPVDGNLGSFIDDGDSLINDYANLGTINNVPIITEPPPAPVIISGSGVPPGVGNPNPPPSGPPYCPDPCDEANSQCFDPTDPQCWGVWF